MSKKEEPLVKAFDSTEPVKADVQIEQSASWKETLTKPQILAPILGLVILFTATMGLRYWQNRNVALTTPDGVIDYPLGDSPMPEENKPLVLEEGSFYAPPIDENVDVNAKPNPNASVQWKTPTKLANLNIVGFVYPDPQGEINYYNIGSRNGSDIILAEAPAVDPSGTALYFFEKTSDGYTFMSKMSNYNIYHNAGFTGNYFLSNLVKRTDMKTYYIGIIGPSTLSYGGVNLVQEYLNPTQLFTSYVEQTKEDDSFSYKKLSTVPEGDIYQIQFTRGGENGSSEKFYARRYFLKLPSGLYTNYNVKFNFFSDNQVPKITWADGSVNAESYRYDGGGGCGNPGAYIVSTKDISGMVKVAGTAGADTPVYEFKDSTNPTVKYYYEQQNGTFYNRETQQPESITIEKWHSNHALIAIKNASGEYMLMTSDKYGAAAECGKPVVYLYPTKPTNVSVKVGADITISEPAYETGWNVLAQPNGLLTTSDKKTYESLFWEGLGHGEYPQINSGFVVARENVETAISEQLTALGLNQKESQDFKDFWFSRMPNTPYVRLTWFTTAEMDKLAPLYINPKPNTVIRIFLDYQGLQQKINLPSQQLSSIPRNGFTVIEWGGLLRK